MKKYTRCIWSTLIFMFYWALLGKAQDSTQTASIPDISITENNSTDNVSEQNSVDSSNLNNNELEPSVEDVGRFTEKNEENGNSFSHQVFAEATTNSGVANEFTTSDQPVVITLADVASKELEKAINPSSQSENPPPVNQTDDSKKDEEIDTRSEPTRDSQTENLPISNPNSENLTEEIPSFSEWTQKRLEEAEKKESSNGSTQHQTTNGKQTKLRWKNYASLDCGAKVVASNPEAVSPSAILSPSRDEYKLNTCTSRIWFIVELCEAIQAKKIDFANFELFSSSPKDFTVSVSDRFPTRDWSVVGQFTAKDERDIQSFDLHPHLFAKYVKVEVKSHYGSEHYCPISLFRVYGTSEFEVLQKEDPVHANRLEDDDGDDDDDETLDLENGDASKNLFSSATDAVISMVKKAAQVLGKKDNLTNNTKQSNNTNITASQLVKICLSPSHLVVCDNCSDTLFGKIYEFLSCHANQVKSLIEIPLIKKALIHSNICKQFGFEFKESTKSTINSQSHLVESFLSKPLLGAICNSVAIQENKIVLNVSNQYSNTTKPATDDDKLINIETSEPHIAPTFKQPEFTDTLTLETTEGLTRSTCSTDVSLTSQIKPTKTLTPDLNFKEMNTEGPPLQQEENTVTVSVDVSPKLNVPEPDNQIEISSESEIMQESTETLDDHLEHFISEFNGESQVNIQAATTATPQAQKESVFLRLSNRIKALERNMSLSSQYLEELSKRYKKQVEEIQKLLDKTIQSMFEENKKKDEYNKRLEERLDSLTATLEVLLAEKNSWSSTLCCAIISTLVTLFILTFCVSRSPEPQPEIQKQIKIKRRKSIDIVRPSGPVKKKRRPSDQALKIVRSSSENPDTNPKKKRKKKQVIQRSNSINTLIEEFNMFKPSTTSSHIWCKQESTPDWVEDKKIEEIPFVLEESEHTTLETLPDGVAPPNFFKTALNSRVERINGNKAMKSTSVDETSRNSSPVPSINGNLSRGDNHQVPKKDRRGLKKIFKKFY